MSADLSHALTDGLTALCRVEAEVGPPSTLHRDPRGPKLLMISVLTSPDLWSFSPTTCSGGATLMGSLEEGAQRPREQWAREQWARVLTWLGCVTRPWSGEA